MRRKKEKDLAVFLKNQLTLFTWGAEKKITNEAHIGCWTEKEFFCVEIFISPNKDRDIHQEKGGYGIGYKGAKTGNVRVKPDVPLPATPKKLPSWFFRGNDHEDRREAAVCNV